MFNTQPPSLHHDPVNGPPLPLQGRGDRGVRSRPLNILIVTSIYPTQKEPGLGAFVASQVSSLRKLGLEVDVLFLDVRRSKWELIRGIGRIKKALKTKPYDLIHAHFGYNGVPVCFQKQVPFVMSYCGTDLHHHRLRPISKWVARRADACIVKSQSLHTLLNHPATVIPNGVDMDRFHPGDKREAKRRLKLNLDKQYVLFVTTDLSRPEKRYDLARQAVEQSGAELLLLHNRPPEESPVYFQAADALIMSSTYEGSPNVIKEGMACNLPIVSTDVGDVSSVITNTHNCQICNSTPEALAEGLRKVLHDGQPSNGRDNIMHLSSDRIAAQIVQLYHRILNKEATS